ncbi:hypothetical protein [Luteibacter sp. UNCMF366Tsu5.1]|uniref:hypothetical protein n=1 Tax=Luteibacter sp. UNCMF366Tsu5.1 TaxID=1502758 RepID=UPI0015A5E219|nr:hypothetical protein [Luteibacter sp. UNCMF366Tsu5.1]
MVMIIFLAGLAHQARAAAHYLTLINDTSDALSLMEIRAVGTSIWVSMDSGWVRGGRLDEATVAFPDGGCVWDLRVTEVGHADHPRLECLPPGSAALEEGVSAGEHDTADSGLLALTGQRRLDRFGPRDQVCATCLAPVTDL